MLSINIINPKVDNKIKHYDFLYLHLHKCISEHLYLHHPGFWYDPLDFINSLVVSSFCYDRNIQKHCRVYNLSEGDCNPWTLPIPPRIAPLVLICYVFHQEIPPRTHI